MKEKLGLRTAIRFKNGALYKLRENLFSDSSKEAFAVALAGTREVCGITNIVIYDIIFPQSEDYNSRSLAHLSLEKGFVYRTIAEAVERLDVNTIIDIHTHPFTENGPVAFSSIDDQDEERFFSFLHKRFDLQYGSLVLAPGSMSARLWRHSVHGPVHEPVLIKTQTDVERQGVHDVNASLTFTSSLLNGEDAILNRSVLALGLDTMRSITGNNLITVAGVGGLGSIIAEHLVHMGFQHIGLVDHDALEITNMNRIVGASFSQARRREKKTAVIKTHLERINPKVSVTALDCRVSDPKAEALLAASDWIILGTDNHSSRFTVQQLALEHFVPLISAGVNISTQNDVVTDTSGEVIIIRAGDGYCLQCLNRINHSLIAYELHPSEKIQKQLVARGYVSGRDVKEPAVKTLNTMLATMAVDRLIDQFVAGRPDHPVWVYENNGNGPCIYPDPQPNEQQSGCSMCDM